MHFLELCCLTLMNPIRPAFDMRSWLGEVESLLGLFNPNTPQGGGYMPSASMRIYLRF
jgi:hypothetical protein